MGWLNQVIKERPDAVHNNLWDNLINGVAKTNRAELVHILRVGDLGNEGDKSVVEVRRHYPSIKERLNESMNITFDFLPKSLEKKMGWSPSGPGDLKDPMENRASLTSASETSTKYWSYCQK